MTTRVMYDGIKVADLPAGAALYAGYLDGHWQTVPALRKRFPSARIVEIAVRASTVAGHVLDVETGDASPSEAVGWVVARRHAGGDPTVYCNASTWPAVRAAFRTSHVAEPHYWIAQYDGHAAVPAGAVAKQYRSTAGYDESVVAAEWPGVDPAPPPTPDPEDNVLSADDKKWIANEIAAQIKAALPAIAKAVAHTDGLYTAPAGRADVSNTTWSLESVVTDIDGKVRALTEQFKPVALEVTGPVREGDGGDT